MQVLVTGGAGYIGSVVVEELLDAGHGVVVLDNLSKGYVAAVDPRAKFVHGDIMDADLLRTLMRAYAVDSVVHMAASSLVGESVRDPHRYFENNLQGGHRILGAMKSCGVRRLVFSSSAAVYGEPDQLPIREDAPTAPTNPYGETKLQFERALRWHEEAYGLRYTSLRYFNAAGATERCGEWHDPETHLIPIVLRVAMGRLPNVTIHGDDYPTPDGTCLRDYLHVSDLARAHVLALEALGHCSRVYNLGCGGHGYSVSEVLDAARRITGHEIPAVVGPRRPGDPAALVASSERIRSELGWEPRLQDLEAIVGSAWAWLQRHPDGYARDDKDGRTPEPTEIRILRSELEDGRRLYYYSAPATSSGKDHPNV